MIQVAMATLTITHVIYHKTPQSGSWLHCFQATAGNASATHNVRDKEYKGDDARVDMNLVLTPVTVNSDTCRFSIGLDDDQADVCSPQAEDQTSGTFPITSMGSQTYSAGDDWNYTIFWRADEVPPATARATRSGTRRRPPGARDQ
jgi:hypothetical protein